MRNVAYGATVVLTMGVVVVELLNVHTLLIFGRHAANTQSVEARTPWLDAQLCTNLPRGELGAKAC